MDGKGHGSRIRLNQYKNIARERVVVGVVGYEQASIAFTRFHKIVCAGACGAVRHMSHFGPVAGPAVVAFSCSKSMWFRGHWVFGRV